MINGVKITDLDLDFVKNYLKIDYDADDQLISTMIVAAQNFIQAYLNKKFEDFEVIPDEFTIAALAIIAHWYENRQIQSLDSTKNVSELQYVFSGLLDLYRNWNNESFIDSTDDDSPLSQSF
jgi:uncharacterized phage protein (predicted DNA packaging)